MSIPAKALVFLAAILVGVLAALYMSPTSALGARLHGLHIHFMDFLIWTFGALFVGSAIYKLVTQPDDLGWSWGFWLLFGSVMIYAELANATWLKEASCRMIISGRHHHTWTGPCYQPD